ncbi:MAG: exo-alpha-sialidase [Lentisphaeria bacterium]|nr:exo-alpha-sialidase [Lentisphaeria bacterium]
MIDNIVLDLSHSAGNPRNSEGAFATLGDGRLVYAYSRYYGDSWSDHATADIAARYSDDDGRTWTAEDRILVKNEGGCNVMSVSFLRLNDGRLALFYLRKNSIEDCHLQLRISEDDGETWGDPVCCIPAPGYFVVNNDRVVQLASGRLLVVAGFHRCKVSPPNDQMDSRSIMISYFSDDGGVTWSEGADWVILPVKCSSGLQEPGVVQLRDGSLYGWCRTETGCQWETRSTDDGNTWDLAQESPFAAPCSPLGIKRDPFDGRLVAVWNDHSGTHFPAPQPDSDAWRHSWGRTPLVMAFSDDEGKTWCQQTLVDDRLERGFCYTATHFTRDAILLGYCCGGPANDGQTLQDSCVRRITREEA